MSLKKVKLAVAVAAVLALSASVFAQVEVTPYGGAHYRLRTDVTMLSDNNDNSNTVANYSNHVAWRLGLRAKVDEQLSLQFQIGNDWAASEGVNWRANNFIGARVGEQNLYVHLASARWNPGFMFVEAGVVPLASNGTLDLLRHSINRGSYDEAGFFGWGDFNNSMIGLKLGVPILTDDVKVGVELFQSVIDPRRRAESATESDANLPSILMVLTVPVIAGDFRITPEFTSVINRYYTPGNADHEFIFGLAGSYKVSDEVTVNFNGGYGMVSNENTTAADTFKNNGLLVGASTVIKAGPGNLMIGANYNRAWDSEIDDCAMNYIYGDLRYAYKVHPNFVITPRYRPYVTLFPEDQANKMRFNNRIELILEGSF